MAGGKGKGVQSSQVGWRSALLCPPGASRRFGPFVTLIFVVTLEHELVHVKRRSGASCVDRAEFWAGDPERSQGAVEPRFWYGSPNAHREVGLRDQNDVLQLASSTR